MAKIIVIASGKGGVGKSSLTVGLCYALSSAGKTVMAIDCDVGLRSLDIILGVRESVVFDWGDILLGRCEPVQAMVRTRGPVLMSAPLEWNEAFTPENFKRMIKCFESYYDYIIIDSPAGVTRGFHLAAYAAHQGLIVSTPDEVCVRSVSIAANELYNMNKEPPRLVINRFDKKLVLKGRQLNIDEVINAAGVQLIGIVPEDKLTAYCMTKGFALPDESPAAIAFYNIAQRLNGTNIPLKL